MGCSDDETRHETTTADEALPELDPWRQVGWIFRDEGCVAIARRDAALRAGVVGD